MHYENDIDKPTPNLLYSGPIAGEIMAASEHIKRLIGALTEHVVGEDAFRQWTEYYAEKDRQNDILSQAIGSEAVHSFIADLDQDLYETFGKFADIDEVDTKPDVIIEVDFIYRRVQDLIIDTYLASSATLKGLIGPRELMTNEDDRLILVFGFLGTHRGELVEFYPDVIVDSQNIWESDFNGGGCTIVVRDLKRDDESYEAYITRNGGTEGLDFSRIIFPYGIREFTGLSGDHIVHNLAEQCRATIVRAEQHLLDPIFNRERLIDLLDEFDGSE
jgi:hypothetical protein